MPLTVLSDQDVNRILHSFGKTEIEQLQQAMADALHTYSVSNDTHDCSSDSQPERIAMKRKNGSTTLFMPASGMTGQGVKVVNVLPPDTSGLPSMENLSLDTSHSSRSSLSQETTHSSTASISTVSTASSQPTTASGRSVSPSNNQSTIRGSLLIMDDLGQTKGLINAEEVTAFRTALVSTMMLKKRQSVHDMTVFGAGKQAYWHIRLSLLLRADEIHHVNVITRNFDTARACLMRLYNPLPDDPDYVNTIGERYNSRTKKTILTPSHTEYERLLKEYVRSSNVIFCCTPSTTPLFPASYLTNPEGRKKGRYIACIGSYKPHMVELHPDVLRHAVEPHHEHRHLHKRQSLEGGAIVVDTVTGCLKEAGEIIQAQIRADQVVEIGELVMLKREAIRAMETQGQKVESGCNFQRNSGLNEWLTKGNVIIKIVGMGLMDITVGNEILAFAKERGIGTTIDNF